MKQYPSIPRDLIKGIPFYVFDKLDGSNIRAEWNHKKGFWKFGSKNHLIDEKSNGLGKFSIPLIKNQEKEFALAFGNDKEVITCFFEFFGLNSFAGVHDFENINEQFQAVLIDCCRKGFMMPKDFIKTFDGKVKTASLLYHGNITEELIDSVRNRTLSGMTFEGVICKGSPLKNGYPPYMCKIKSAEWIQKVKTLYTDPKQLEELI